MKPDARTGSSTSQSPFFGLFVTIRQFMTKRHMAYGLLAAIGAAVLLAARAFPTSTPSAAAPEAAPSAAPLPVAAAHPEPADGYLRVRSFTGDVRPRRASVLGFERAGRILRLDVDAGDTVTAEAILGVIDVDKVRSLRDGVAAGRIEAAAILAELRAGPRAEVIAAARQNVADLDARAGLLDSKLRRRARLLADGTLSREEHDEIETALASTRAKLAGAKEKLGELEAGTRKERIEAQTARVARLDADIARLELEIADGTLKAPFAGRVLKRHVDEGRVVQAGAPILTLVEDAVLEAWVGVPPSVALALQPGSTHTVRVGEGRFKATLRSRLPSTDVATRTQTLVLDLPADAATQAVPGQVARLEVEEPVSTTGHWLPATALTKGVRGLWSVYGLKASDGSHEVVRHHVEVLHKEAERVLVRGTVGADDLVIVGDLQRVVPGQRVRLETRPGNRR